MKNHDVLFDKTNKRLGLVRADCEAVNNISSPEVTESEGKTPTTTTEEQTAKNETTTTGTGTAVTTTESSSDDGSGAKTVVILICVGAIIGLIAYFFFKNIKKNKYADM